MTEDGGHGPMDQARFVDRSRNDFEQGEGFDPEGAEQKVYNDGDEYDEDDGDDYRSDRRTGEGKGERDGDDTGDTSVESNDPLSPRCFTGEVRESLLSRLLFPPSPQLLSSRSYSILMSRSRDRTPSSSSPSIHKLSKLSRTLAILKDTMGARRCTITCIGLGTLRIGRYWTWARATVVEAVTAPVEAMVKRGTARRRKITRYLCHHE